MQGEAVEIRSSPHSCARSGGRVDRERGVGGDGRGEHHAAGVDRHQLHVGVSVDLRSADVHAGASQFRRPSFLRPGPVGLVHGRRVRLADAKRRQARRGHRPRDIAGPAAWRLGDLTGHVRRSRLSALPVLQQVRGQGPGRRQDSCRGRVSAACQPGVDGRHRVRRQGWHAGRRGELVAVAGRRPQAGLRRQRSRRTLRRVAVHRAKTGYAGEWRVDDIWIDPRARH